MNTMASIALTNPVAQPAMTMTLAVGGMTCASCSGRVEKALRKVPGVVAAEVNLATEMAEVHASPNAVDAAALIVAIEKAGYTAHEVLQDHPEDSTPHIEPFWPVALAIALALPLVAPMLAGIFGHDWMLSGW